MGVVNEGRTSFVCVSNPEVVVLYSSWLLSVRDILHATEDSGRILMILITYAEIQHLFFSTE